METVNDMKKHEELKVWASDETIYVDAKNIPQLRELLAKANEQAANLSKTLHQLNCFSLELKLISND